MARSDKGKRVKGPKQQSYISFEMLVCGGVVLFLFWYFDFGRKQYATSDPMADHTKMAMSYMEDGEDGKALQSFKAAVNFRGGAKESLNLGVAQQRARRYSLALESYQQAIELAPGADGSSIVESATRHKLAIEAFLESGGRDGSKMKHDMQPFSAKDLRAYRLDDPKANHRGAALHYDMQGDMQSAVGAFKAQVRFSPNIAAAYNDLGAALTKAAAALPDMQAQRAQYQEAQIAYKSAFARDPTDSILKDNMLQLENFLQQTG
jgi:tetratricopeptide (TPR) repeat protein